MIKNVMITVKGVQGVDDEKDTVELTTEGKFGKKDGKYFGPFMGGVSIKEVLEIDDNPWVSLEFVIDAFIWLLNAHGAKITRLDAKDDIPMICNWTCNGFETVGYGCFW